MSDEQVDAATTGTLDRREQLDHTLTTSITWPLGNLLSSNGRPASYLLNQHILPPAPTGTAPVDTSSSLTLTFLAVCDIGFLMFSVRRALVDPITSKLVFWCFKQDRMLPGGGGWKYSPNNPPRVQHSRKPTENCE